MLRTVPDRFSIVVTVRNEERNLPALMDSLVPQEPPLEIVIVDAHSTDRTREIASAYAGKYDFVRLYEQGGTRGAGRNFGVWKSHGVYAAFIDGDCIASPFWLRNLRKGTATAEIVAGKTVPIGYRAFEALKRVELHHHGFDITVPSCNLAYPRERFLAIGGFDEWFMTAEDIDLNLRAVDAGATIGHEPEAIVYHRTRGSYYGFLRQAFWNGAGRKQLTLKHGRLWSSYRPRELFRQQASPAAALRLGAAMLGYVGYKAFGKPREAPS